MRFRFAIPIAWVLLTWALDAVDAHDVQFHCPPDFNPNSNGCPGVGDGIVNVSDYDTLPPFGEIDHAELQCAIDCLDGNYLPTNEPPINLDPVGPSVVLEFQPGLTYRLDAPVRMPVSTPARLTVKGNGAVLELNYASGPALHRDLEVPSNFGTCDMAALAFLGQRWTIENLTFQRVSGNPSGIELHATEGLTIRGCSFRGLERAVTLRMPLSAKIENCYFFENRRNDVAIEPVRINTCTLQIPPKPYAPTEYGQGGDRLRLHRNVHVAPPDPTHVPVQLDGARTTWMEGCSFEGPRPRSAVQWNYQAPAPAATNPGELLARQVRLEYEPTPGLPSTALFDISATKGSLFRLDAVDVESFGEELLFDVTQSSGVNVVLARLPRFDDRLMMRTVPGDSVNTFHFLNVDPVDPTIDRNHPLAPERWLQTNPDNRPRNVIVNTPDWRVLPSGETPPIGTIDDTRRMTWHEWSPGGDSNLRFCCKGGQSWSVALIP